MKNKNLKILLGLIFFGSFFMAGSVRAGTTPITHLGVNNTGGFPVALSTAGETYQLIEDITCATTCFTAKASNIILDLNGHTATFGTSNNPGMLNTGMENWFDTNTLSNWTVLDGTVTQIPAKVWGSYDAELSATTSIKSDPVTLNADQTYVYYSMLKGSSADSYTVSLRSAADDSVLATSNIDGGLLNRAFAMTSGVVNAVENNYKPSSNVSVYLQIDCAGTSAKRLHVADIKPSNHYFIAWSNYRSTSYPDLADNLFGGIGLTGGTIENGIINQGAGDAVKSVAINGGAFTNINNVNINMSGNNTGAIATSGTFTIDNANINTSSILNFNRMHPPVSIDFIHSASGTSEIKNCTILNDPEQSMREINGAASGSDIGTLRIHNNTIRGNEQVTEGYAIILSGGNVNVEIDNNNINPIKGRGILLDSVAGTFNGNKNISIHDNTIQNIYERITPEYGANELEAAGIRVRDWGGANAGHRNLQIYDNNISVYADAAGTHRSYGINLTSQSINTTADIYNNTISALLNSSGGADWEATCITLQGADMTSGGSINIHNNVCNGNIGFRLGGNDGVAVKNIEIYENDINTDKANINYYGYLGPFADNSIYCNKFNNTSTTGYPIYFEDGTPTVTNQWLSNNQITNSNASGNEILLNKNYSSSVISCGNGTLDIFGGGQIGTASDPCHDGFAGCYSTAGLTNPDLTAPSAPSGLSVL